MKKVITCILTLGLTIAASLTTLAEPKLEDLELNNYSLYSTVTIDLHDAIKDPGNEYVIKWYANEELVNEVYGLFGNQIITYQYVMEDCVGKQVYASIEAYNTKEVAKTEKRILEPAKGKVNIKQDGNTVKVEYSDFDNTTEYSIDWIIDNSIKNGLETYKINSVDIGKNIRCKVTSLNTNHSVLSNSLIIGSENTSLVGKTNKKGEWINGVNGRWYSYSDGTHPVGVKRENGRIEYCWELIENKWFAFNDMGYAVDGLIIDNKDGETYYTNSVEGLKVGWQLIDDKWYYFNEIHDGSYGKLLRNTVTPDGYMVNDLGIWIE